MEAPPEDQEEVYCRICVSREKSALFKQEASARPSFLADFTLMNGINALCKALANKDLDWVSAEPYPVPV